MLRSFLRQINGQRILVGLALVLSLAAHLWILDVFVVDEAVLPNLSTDAFRRDSSTTDTAAFAEVETRTRTQPTLQVELDGERQEGLGARHHTERGNHDSSIEEENKINLKAASDLAIHSFRDGNQIEISGVNVDSPIIFKTGMAIIYVQYDNDQEAKMFLERTAGVLEPWEADDIREQYGDSILFFGNVEEKIKKIRRVGLVEESVNSGILLGKTSITLMSRVLKENGIDSNTVRNKLIRFRFNNETGEFSFKSISSLN